MKILSKKLFGLTAYNQSEVIKDILDSPEALEIFQELLEKKHQSVSQSRAKAKKILLELSSSYSKKSLYLSYWAVRILQKFLFSKIATYGDGIDSIRNLTKQKKILFFLPNHKSHMDYLLLSYILFNDQIAPPHIAAGVNLSFWPMGPIFRKTGAYFIRRKIAGNFLYTKFLELYFKWMLKEKISQEFYMEGGRSRDGKLRTTQSGIFTLFVEQVLSLQVESEIYIIPTSITYDRVPEMKSLTNELLGSEKRQESAFSLASAISLLFRKHGQVHVNFGQPVEIKPFLENGFSKKTFQELSKQIFGQIQNGKITTTSAVVGTILLANGDQIDSDQLLKQVHWIIKLLQPCQLCLSEDLVNIQKNQDSILRTFENYGWFKKQGKTLLIQNSKRLEMNYYKNDLVPFLIPHSINAFSIDLDAKELSFVKEIFHHEYPFADERQRKGISDKDQITFLKNIHIPMFHLYREVLRIIIEQKLTDLLSKEVQENIMTTLDSQFYIEMNTTESIRSACRFFHQRFENLKNQAVVENWKKILDSVLPI